jgi:hypothetical protein
VYVYVRFLGSRMPNSSIITCRYLGVHARADTRACRSSATQLLRQAQPRDAEVGVSVPCIVILPGEFII